MGRSSPPTLLVAATHSGAGKTTVTASIMRALRDAGLRVQPFKLGPDFIDPAYLSEAAGRPAVNLDLWMMGPEGVKSSFASWSADADIAVIEAMGALYDGEDGSASGSAATVAKLLGAPVVLVLDVWGMTRTAGAVLLGMREFDPAVRIAGCVLNRTGSETHREMILAALPAELRSLVVGAIPRADALEIPERHLGLLTAAENQADATARSDAQRRAGGGLDVEQLTAIAAAGPPPMPVAVAAGRGEGLRRPAAVGHGEGRRRPAPVWHGESPAPRPRARLAVARDAAFCFYYEDNLKLLAQAGFELVPFRPTGDAALPEGVDAVYLGGGYPESFAPELAANAPLLTELRGRASRGMPIYAECGGLLYLGRSLTGFDGERHAMSGVIPLDVRMDPAHLAISYVEARTRARSPLGEMGTAARGQEFHQSRIAAGPEPTLYDLTTSGGERRQAGFLQGNVAASYVHLHLASCPDLAPSLVASAIAARC